MSYFVLPIPLLNVNFSGLIISVVVEKSYFSAIDNA